jgi:peptide/nickel transport system substrate-binding protein
MFGLVMNLQHPYFADLSVRQAIAKAIDRDSLAKVLAGAVPAYAFVTPGMVAYSSEAETYSQQLHPHDVAAAQALLAEAGWVDSDGDGIVEKDGEPFSVEFLVNANAIKEQQASQVLQTQLKEIGIDLQISQQDRGYINEAKAVGNHEMVFDNYGWPDPDILSVIFGNPYWNPPKYENPELIEAMNTARYLIDPAERTEAYVEIQKTLLDDVAEIPLWQNNIYIALNNNVQGFIFTENRQLLLNDVMVVE